MTETKIVSLETAAERVAAHKAAGRVVVMCHGVFDLVHPGHIRHFEAARHEGNVLVVTVTPDRHVNKGPGRPVFDERLRAESLAALQAVDIVAVNEWPTAVEPIRLLKPDVYVKGDDYEAREEDVTGKIFEEERAVVEAGGRIHFTHDITFSSSQLLNSHFSALSDEAGAFLGRFRNDYSSEDVVTLLKSLEKMRVRVVGDAIIDEYHFCRAYGMASKSATIAAQIEHEELYAGGALAVANHLAGFCGEVELVTCLGMQDTREEFIRSQLLPNVVPRFHYRPDAPTTMKRRYVHSFLVTKLFEVTRYSDAPLPPEVEGPLASTLRAGADDFDLTLVADFGQGLFGQATINAVTETARFLAVNAQTNAINLGYNLVTRYPRADYVSIDAQEAHLAYGDRHAPLDAIIEDLATRLDARQFTITLGHRGSMIRASDGSVVQIPVFSRQVVDTIGAGDAFLALTAPCAALGCPSELIGFVGNAVAALAVQVIGNMKPVEPVPLYKFISTLLK